ncbi:MAG: UDP-N-acetylmuramoyl-L-alanyl-D-glutamate--2,6-diaminopimelate ligase [Acidimicrobiales bacterium]
MKTAVNLGRLAEELGVEVTAGTDSGRQAGTDSGRQAGISVTSIDFDSRHVSAGSLFCCVPGEFTDGHVHAAEAVRRGAAAIMCERPLGLGVPELQVAPGQARSAMARLAAAFWDYPSRSMKVVGVTGTNGKTTVVHMLDAIFQANGQSTAMVGTLGGARTTPESPVLQALLGRFRQEGRTAVAMEVSSHAMIQHRVDQVNFDVAVFTNLSQDHLDFHGDMDEYFAAKASLFTPQHARRAVVNADDPWGRRLMAIQQIPTVGFSATSAAAVCIGAGGSTFTWNGQPVALRLGGSFNVTNAVAAASAAAALGIGDEAIAAGLTGLDLVPGRFEAIRQGQDFAVIVDYAHTPEGLNQVLQAARQAAGPRARVIVVFGCGGDRDHSKRPRMGQVATDLADLAVLTTDNPRSEDPHAILAEVASGSERRDVLIVEPDRRQAIELAISRARPGDVVIVAGKGHEQFQILADGAVPFDDRTEASGAISRIWGSPR